MSRKKAKNLYGYKFIPKPRIKRPGRHSKKRNKKNTRKKYRGQGRA